MKNNLLFIAFLILSRRNFSTFFFFSQTNIDFPPQQFRQNCFLLFSRVRAESEAAAEEEKQSGNVELTDSNQAPIHAERWQQGGANERDKIHTK
jgi:hypothetical protein